jgi:TRAP-type uncharacterized transport system fused permease subunit
MFKSVSWQEFIIAASVAAVCYYTAIIIIFYLRDFAARLKGGQVSAQAKECESPRPPGKNLMGPIAPVEPIRKKPVVQSSATADELEVAENTNVPVVQKTHSTPAEELLQELGNLFEIMKEGKPCQESYIRNIKTLVSQYTHLMGTAEYARISKTIIEELKAKHNVFLPAEAVDELWPKENVKNNNHLNK